MNKKNTNNKKNIIFKIGNYIQNNRDEKGRLPVTIRMVLLLIFLIILFNLRNY